MGVGLVGMPSITVAHPEKNSREDRGEGVGRDVHRMPRCHTTMLFVWPGVGLDYEMQPK